MTRAVWYSCALYILDLPRSNRSTDIMMFCLVYDRFVQGQAVTIIGT